MTERLYFTVQNSIPMLVPLSETLRNTVKRSREFINSDYDAAVVDKIIMVLVNSETISKKGVVASPDDGADGDDGDHVMQREEVWPMLIVVVAFPVILCFPTHSDCFIRTYFQVSEEEVLQEQGKFCFDAK